MALYNVTVRTADNELTTVTVDAPTIADARTQALQQSETGSSVVSTTPISVDFSDAPPATTTPTTGVDPQDPLALSETRTGVGDFYTPPATLGGFGPEGFIEGDLEGTARPDGGVFEATRAMPALSPDSFTSFTQQAPTESFRPRQNIDEIAARNLAQEGVLSDLDVEDISPTAAVTQALNQAFPGVGRAGPVSNFLRRQALNLFFDALPGQQIRAELDPTFRQELATRRGLTPTGSPTVDALAAAESFSEEPLSETRTPFTDYYRRLAESAGGTRGGFQEAADNLRFLRNLGVGAATGQFGQYFAPTAADETDAALDLIQGARRGRFSPAVRTSGPSQSEVFGDYLLEANRRAGEGLGTPNFLDFAAGRFGL